MSEDSGNNLFGTIMTDALQFATPFAQRVLNQSSTPQEVQNDVLRTSALNGSGPVDHTLASQAPLGLLDFITGGRVTGQGGTQSNTPQGGLGLQNNFTLFGIVAIVLVALFVFLRK